MEVKDKNKKINDKHIVAQAKDATKNLNPLDFSINEEPGQIYSYEKSKMQKSEKIVLAEYIVKKYIKDFLAVAIDAGTTQQAIIEEMMSQRSFLSILTNNMTAFKLNSRQNVDKTGNEFILTGGKYVALFDALLGEETLNSFNVFIPNILIIGVSGLDVEKGFLCHGNDEVSVKRYLFNKKVDTLIIPADYNKLGKADSYPFGSIDEFKNRKETKCVIVACPPVNDFHENMNKKVKSEKLELFSTNVKKFQDKGINVDVVELNS